jgi:hypothetical protein
VADFLLGARLAMQAGRAGWARLALSVVGIGAGVLVLLYAASAQHAFRASQARADGLTTVSSTAPPGVTPVDVRFSNDEFRGQSIIVIYVHGTGGVPALPPGVSRLPANGEAVVSPALGRLMSGSDGELLRQRYPQTVIGRIGHAGLIGPADQRIYLGVREAGGDKAGTWGLAAAHDPVPPLLWALLVVGIVVLLFPVFVFVAASARLADAERDRRLGTLRLIGASAAQVRRVAAGESLLAAGLGLLLGGGLFLLTRPLIEGLTVLQLAVFSDDVVPARPLVALIVVAVPLLAAGSALFALRHTVIEPLGVVRQAGPPRRRLWWRLLPAATGVALLLYLLRPATDARRDRPVTALVLGVVLLLLGIPTVLPWLLQRVLRRPRNETLALQLATRRLLLDSGTPARVVSGIGVVLAGAIGLSSLLAAAAARYGPTAGGLPPGQATVSVDAGLPTATDRLAAALPTVPGVTSSHRTRALTVDIGQNQMVELRAGDCSALSALAVLPSCVDGQAFLLAGSPVAAGQRVRINPDQVTTDGPAAGVPWTVPAAARTVRSSGDLARLAMVLVTPKLLPPSVAPLGRSEFDIRYNPADRDAVERIRTAAAPLAWRSYVAAAGSVYVVGDDHTYRTIRRGLLASALFTLALAGATLLVGAVDQVRQRRWPLAALAASGVPRSTLARSVLWQNAIPVAVAVLVADVTGVALADLVLPAVGVDAMVDWRGVGIYSTAAVAVVGVVTALTLPAVRQATRPTALRSE